MPVRKTEVVPIKGVGFDGAEESGINRMISRCDQAIGDGIFR